MPYSRDVDLDKRLIRDFNITNSDMTTPFSIFSQQPLHTNSKEFFVLCFKVMRWMLMMQWMLMMRWMLIDAMDSDIRLNTVKEREKAERKFRVVKDFLSKRIKQIK